MGRLGWLALALATVGACTLDFEQFQTPPEGTPTVGAAESTAAAGETTTTGAAGGPAGPGGGPSSSTSGPGGNGGATGSGGSEGGAGGGSTPLSVNCPTAPCDVTGAGVCCLQGMSGGQCLPSGMCMPLETTVNCDGPEDCPNQVCCGTFSLGLGYTTLECSPNCNGQSEFIICDSAGPMQCQGNTTCQSSTYLPTGYEVCK